MESVNRSTAGLYGTGWFVTDPKELADKILSLDKNIRYVGILDETEFKILESRMQNGLESFTANQDDRWLIELFSPIIMGAAQRLEKDVGRIAYSVVRYEKVTLVVARIQGYLVTLSVHPSITVRPLYERIKKSLHE